MIFNLYLCVWDHSAAVASFTEIRAKIISQLNLINGYFYIYMLNLVLRGILQL